jgi:arylsulfatase A-like enzyme
MSLKQPNVLVVITDDHRHDALGCAGNRLAITPSLDALAAKGVRFTQAIATTAICCASRAAIYTGMYNRRNGVHDFATEIRPADFVDTYFARLRSAGWFTGYVGKWGVADNKPLPKAQFDIWSGFPGQGFYWNKHPKTGERIHMTDLQTEQCLDFLKAVPSGRPWNLTVAFKAPHAEDGHPQQFVPQTRFESLLKDVPVDVDTGSDFASLPAHIRNSEGRERWKARFAEPEKGIQMVKDYYRLVAGVDDAIGAILREVAARGELNDTVVVVVGDNGMMLGEHGLTDKWFPYDVSVRVPLIVVDPRMLASERGKVSDCLTANIDVSATVLECCGLRAGNRVQGKALIKRGRVVSTGRKWMYYEHHFKHDGIARSEGIRSQREAYFWYPDFPEAGEFLFDLRRDPGQLNNLAGTAAGRRRCAALRPVLDMYRTKAG